MNDVSTPERTIIPPPQSDAFVASTNQDLSPVVDTFTLADTLPPRLVETVRWHMQTHGIRDPEEELARRFSNEMEPQYDAFVADFLAYASTWAYSDPATFAFMMAHRGTLRWRFFHVRLVNDPLYVVATAYLMQSYTGDVAILVFRGTEPTDVMNWMTDLTIKPERFLEGNVHGGILRNLRAQWPLISMGLHTLGRHRNLMVLPLEPRLQKDQDLEPDPKLEIVEKLSCAQCAERHLFDNPWVRLRSLKAFYIGGHSLGGAMAALSTALVWRTPRWGRLREHLCGCYTYGAPMVAEKQLAQVLDKEIGQLVFRHVYGSDVIPKLPPGTTGPFRHFGHEYRCPAGGDGWNLSSRYTHQTPFTATLPLAGMGLVLDQFTGFRALSPLIPISIDHHSPRYYVRVSELSRTELF